MLADEPVASLDPRNAKIVMDALQRINRHFGLTVLCNLHSLDLARTYCDRLVGMAGGRLVFDGVPEALTDDVARELYGLEADEVMARPDDQPVEAGVHAGRAAHRLISSSSLQRSRHDRPSHSAGRHCRRHRRRGACARRRAWKSDYPELIYAVIPAENASGVTDRYAPFIDYLSKQLGTKVTLRIANDYAALIEGQRAGNIHFGYYGPASFSRAR